ncbi:MAG TPA: ParB/RepB/Spo0J family partition protein [Bacteroidales bacterium]|nr:ParB/RepB/Spo0J family partition protein [Bacteroidales bacterium]
MNQKKRALGRGLNAILQSPDTDITSRDISGDFVAGAIAEIPINLIEANPYQPRDSFEVESLKELTQSIREQGVIQPVSVRKMGYDKYQLISGERRLRASIMAGLEKIPAYLRVANDQQMLELALVENLQREDLNPLAIGIGFQRLIEECNLTQGQLSEKVGKNRSTIANYIRLLKLPAAIQVALRDGKLTMGHARALINIEDEPTQIAILNNILNKDLSVRHVESIVRNLNKEPEDKSPLKEKNEALPPHIETIRTTISEKFDTPVNIRFNNKGKGHIVIAFRTQNEMDRVLNLLTQ